MVDKKNLELWGRVEKTDPTHTKNAKLEGRQITSIDPQYQIKNATREFGVFGVDWGIEESKITPLIVETPEGQEITLFYEGKFFIEKDNKRKYNTLQNALKFRYFVKRGGYWKSDDNAVKKVETDALTKHLSRLGFNADIFMGKFEDSRYINEVSQEFQQKSIIEKVENEIKKASAPKFDAQYFIGKMNEAPNIDTLGSIWKSIPSAMKAECLQAKDSRKNELTQ